MPVLPTWRRPTRLIQPQDPYFNNVSLLLHMNGSNNSTTFTDSSTNGLAVTANGNAKIGTAQSKWGGSSCVLDGSGSYLTIPHTGVLNLSSGDFTIELWAYHVSRPSSGNVQQMLDKDGVYAVSYPSYQIQVTSDGTVNTLLGNGNGTATTFTSYTHGVMALSTWTYIATVKSGNTISTYMNNTLAASGTQGVTMVDGGKSLYVSRYSGGSSDFNGYLQDIRITKGVARVIQSPVAPFPDA